MFGKLNIPTFSLESLCTIRHNVIINNYFYSSPDLSFIIDKEENRHIVADTVTFRAGNPNVVPAGMKSEYRS